MTELCRSLQESYAILENILLNSGNKKRFSSHLGIYVCGSQVFDAGLHQFKGPLLVLLGHLTLSMKAHTHIQSEDHKEIQCHHNQHVHVTKCIPISVISLKGFEWFHVISDLEEEKDRSARGGGILLVSSTAILLAWAKFLYCIHMYLYTYKFPPTLMA